MGCCGGNRAGKSAKKFKVIYPKESGRAPEEKYTEVAAKLAAGSVPGARYEPIP